MPAPRRILGLLWDLLSIKDRDIIDHGVRSLLTGDESGNKLRGVRKILKAYELWENGRPTSRAGGALLDIRRIELHSEILKPGREQDKEDTLFHEIGHVVAWIIFRESGHGKKWVDTMKALGRDHDLGRCHNYSYLIAARDAKRAMATCKVVYTCEDCGYSYHRHRRWKGPRFHPECRSRPQRGELKITSHPNPALIGTF